MEKLLVWQFARLPVTDIKQVVREINAIRNARAMIAEGNEQRKENYHLTGKQWISKNELKI